MESESESDSESRSTGGGSLKGLSFGGPPVPGWESLGGDPVGGVWVVFWVVFIGTGFCGVGGLEMGVPANPSGFIKAGGGVWGSRSGVGGSKLWWVPRGFSDSGGFSMGALGRGFLGDSGGFRVSEVEGSSFLSEER